MIRRLSKPLFLAALCSSLLFAQPAFAQYNAFKDPVSAAASASGGGGGGSDFRAVTDNMQGGKIAVGATAYVVVLFKNQGTSSVTVGKVNLYPSSTVTASLALNQCADAPLATDAQCAITLAVMGKQSGSWRVEMLVDHDGHSRVATASVTGEVEYIASTQDKVSKGDIEASPTSLDFGASPGGSALVRSVVLNNRSAEPIRIKGVSMAAPEKSGFAYKSECPETLQPEETCSIIVTWAPSTKGVTQGVLMVQHTGKSGMAQVELKGDLQQTVSGDIEVNPPGLDFGTSPGGIPVVRSVVLTNHSAEPIQVMSVDMNAPAKSGFSYQSECPQSLQPEETCSIIVTWSPSSRGLAQGVLMVRHSGRSGMAPIEIKGTLDAPADIITKTDGGVDVSPASLDFGESDGSQPLVKSVILSNSSASSVKIKDISLNIPKQSGFSYKSQCGDTLLPDESCSVLLTWQPTTPGASQGVLVIKHTGKTGIAQAEVSGFFVKEGVEEESGVDIPGDIDLLPEDLDFGTSPNGNPLVRFLVLSNNSDEDVEIWDVSLTAPPQSGLSYTSECPDLLFPGETCNIIVNWTPTIKGQTQGVVLVRHSGMGAQIQSQVTAVYQPEGDLPVPVDGDIDVSPALLDFGKSEGGIALVRSVVLTNNAQRVVNIKSVTLSAPEKSGFAYESQCPEGLQPGETCNVIVSWKPTSRGVAQGVLMAKHNGKAGLAQVEVRGEYDIAEDKIAVTDGDLQVSSDSLDFGESSGGLPLVRSISLTNRAGRPVDIAEVALNFPEKSGFTSESQCPATLQQDASCNILVTWKPTTRGLAQGVMVIKHTGKSSVAQLDIKGTYSPPGEASAPLNGDLEISTAEIDFGTSSGGLPMINSVVLKNMSGDKIDIWDVKLNVPEKSGFGYESQCPASLQSGESCNIVMNWKPTSKGLAQGVMVVKHSGKAGILQAFLKAVYDPPEGAEPVVEGDLDVSEPELDFGTSSGGLPIVRSIVLTNNASEEIDIWGIDINVPEESGFTFDSQCPETLMPEETCNVIVSWRPTTKGLAQGLIVVQHSGRSGMLQTDLTATYQPDVGSEPTDGDLEIAPSPLDFGKSEGGIPLVRSLVLTNRSVRTIAIKDMMLDAPEKAGMSYKSQCSAELRPKETCNIIVTWQPTTKGIALGVFAVRNTGKAGLAQVEMKGDYAPSAENDLSEGNMIISPDVLDFGTSPGGIALVRSLLLSNHSQVSVTIRDMSLDVPEKSGYSFKSQCPETLRPDEVCNIIVSWQPTSRGLAQGILGVMHSGKTGLVQAELKGVLEPSVATNAGIYPEKVPDKGLLVSDKEQIDFGTGVKEEAAITLSMVNNGSSELSFRGISLSGASNGLSAAKTGCTKGMVLQPGDACPLTIRWLPTRAGSILDSLQILHSGVRGVLVVPIRGTAEGVSSKAPKEEDAAAENQTRGANGAVSGQPSNSATSSGSSPAAAAAAGNGGGSQASGNASGADEGDRTRSRSQRRESGNAQVNVRDAIQAARNYSVTSHAATRAVINGPDGGQVVRDGEDIVISGMKWTVTIINTGVLLDNGKTEVELHFDRSLKFIGNYGGNAENAVSGGTGAATGSAAAGSATAASAAPAALINALTGSSGAAGARSTPPALNGLQMINQ